MPYWAAARAQPQREAVAQHFLSLKGFPVYLPRLREQRVRNGRKVEVRPVLFPDYLFVQVIAGWWEARWCPGTLGLVMNAGAPVRVPEAVLADIRRREVGGLVELPRTPIKRGDRVRVTRGPLEGHVGLYAGMKPRERVEVLLAILGGAQRVELPRGDVEAAR
jgi:transcriptional antiterminator NusG